MTQQDLANKLNVTRQQINDYCRNERVMSLPTAKNIAAILELNNPYELYEWNYVEERRKRR